MVDVAPLSALRYDPDVAGNAAATSAPVYDLIEPFRYTRHRTANPYTVLELMGPDDAFGRSRQVFDRWRRSGVLVAEPPALYRYEQHELPGGNAGFLHTQRGLLCALQLEPLDRGVVLPHEEVDAGRVAARLRHLESVPAELDPVYLLLVDPPAELSTLLTEPPTRPPVVAATDEAGTDHRIWRWEDPTVHQRVRQLLASTRAVIADGHHRYARSLAFRDRCRAQSRGAGGGEAPWERVFAYLVDPRAGGPRLEAMHRLLAPVSAAQLGRLREMFAFEDAPADPQALVRTLAGEPATAFGLVERARGWVLRPRDEAALRETLPADRSAAWRGLDAGLLTGAVLPKLGFAPSAVRAVGDVDAAAAEVARRSDAALVLLRALPHETVVGLAERGERLPYKSTRFVPKPRTGLLIRPLDGPGA